MHLHLPAGRGRGQDGKGVAAVISFATTQGHFNYRVAGVALDGGRVLVQGERAGSFWTLPGGRAEMLECSPATLRREMHEELGVDVAVGRLLWLVENFFEHAGTPYHELGLYYAMSLPADHPLAAAQGDFPGTERETPLIFRWQPLEALAGLPLLPAFLVDALASPPASTGHVVQGRPPAPCRRPPLSSHRGR
jgi:8-oxo-dGTP pyrophosphatase MutT (NUDIX family)